ncbi:MAG: PTS fructose transporter subunit IIA [Thiobacillaceae bacterium]|jgi:PTS system ascorbate-specific IIA component|nr:PTS fructose transporter subunit IIA [Thiobacillaceae bacterium]
MIGLLVVAHGSLGECLIDSATYVLGRRPDRLEAVDLSIHCDTDRLLAQTREVIDALDEGDGVLVLADIYGATPCNTVCRIIEPGRVEAVAGVNLPMLLKAITYRHDPLGRLAERVVRGAHEGSFHIHPETLHAGA